MIVLVIIFFIAVILFTVFIEDMHNTFQRKQHTKKVETIATFVQKGVQTHVISSVHAHDVLEITPYDSCEISIRDATGLGEPNNLYFVLTNNNMFIGYIAVDKNHIIPVIGSLFVISEKRKNGYARILLEFAEHDLRNHGFTECWGWCTPSLVKYYENTYGFSVRIKNIGIPYVIMSKFL